jgi:DNA polymerase III delta prime subunit
MNELSLPNKIELFHKKIYDKLDYFYKTKKIPHIIFHGSSGSGKRTIVNDFILQIYQSDKNKVKTNVMFVNCVHGKGIKFIREELKFFAKTNIQSNNGIIFKTIVLLNADYLTIDAQSALRRSIELFSCNTRFFIIVENKQKLLNPILSRFCEIYVPEYLETPYRNINLHQYFIEKNFEKDTEEYNQLVNVKMNELCGGCAATDETLSTGLFTTHQKLVEISAFFYKNGISCLDIIKWVETTAFISEKHKSATFMCFDKIKSEYRSEKLLMLYILDYIFMRSNKDLKSIATI